MTCPYVKFTTGISHRVTSVIKSVAAGLGSPAGTEAAVATATAFIESGLAEKIFGNKNKAQEPITIDTPLAAQLSDAEKKKANDLANASDEAALQLAIQSKLNGTKEQQIAVLELTKKLNDSILSEAQKSLEDFNQALNANRNALKAAIAQKKTEDEIAKNQIAVLESSRLVSNALEQQLAAQRKSDRLAKEIAKLKDNQENRDDRAEFNRRLTELKEQADDDLIRLQDVSRALVEFAQDDVNRGKAPITQVAQERIKAADEFFRQFEQKHQEIVNNILERQKLLDSQLTSDNPQAKQEAAELATKLRQERNLIHREKVRAADEDRKAKIEGDNALINSEKELAKISLDIEAGKDAFRLRQLERATKDSISLREFEAKEKAKIAQQELKDELNLVLRTFNRRQGLDGKTALNQPLGLEGVKGFIQRQGTEAPAVNLEALRQILEIEQKIADLNQQLGFNILDAQKEVQDSILEIEKQKISIESTLLDTASRRLTLLKEENAILPEDAKEKELQIERQKLDIIQQRIALLQKEALAGVANVEKNTVGLSPDQRVSALNDFKNGPFAQIIQEVVTLGGEANELTLRLELTGSTLGRFSAGIGELAETLGNVPEPFSKIKDVLLGVKKVIDLLNASTVKAPDTQIRDAATFLSNATVTSATDFRNIIIEAAKLAGAELRGTKPELPKPGEPGSPIPKPNEVTNEKGKIISKVFAGVSSLVEGIFASTAGGKVSGFGNAAGSFLSLIPSLASAAPFIGPIASALGGVIDIFGSVIRKRTEKIASEIQTEFQNITKQFKNGTATLGQTVSKLQDQLISARAKLGSGKTGKKGGKEALAKIETDITNEIETLRQQAKDIQDKFLGDLAKLRLDPDIRSTQTAVDEVFSRVKEFVRSFEDAAEAAKHLGEAEEFATRSLSEQKEQQVKNLRDLLNRGPGTTRSQNL